MADAAERPADLAGARRTGRYARTAYQPTATKAPLVMKWSFARLPRPMKRTFADDLKWAAFFLAGVTIAYFAFGHGDTGLLIGSLIGVTITIVWLNVARRVSRRVKPSTHERRAPER